MDDLETLAKDARVRVRRGEPPNTEGRCVVYWMQRAQRSLDNPALDCAIEVASLLRKPVVAFVGLTPCYPNANLRSYNFFVHGFRDIQEGLRHRNVGFTLCRFPHHEVDRFCGQTNQCVVIGDENPLREPEQWRTAALAVKNADPPLPDRNPFLAQLIVRRELAINFVKFNPNYDRLQGAEPLALRTLDEHRRDGRDPNGYTGISWAMGGKHDRAWGPDRPVYGKIRYMSYASTLRKSDSSRYIERVNSLSQDRAIQ